MATMDDVARHAGVSGSTVSHVLNGTRHVSPATQARVQASIDELGYRHNTVARALAAGKTHTVGLSISALTNPYFGPLVHAIEKRVTDAGYMLVIGDSHDEGVMERRVVESLLSRRVDGLIVAPSVGSEHITIPQILKAGTPLVLIDRNADVDVDQVTPENIESAYRLTSHLIELGHRRIAVVTGLIGLASTSERYAGYARALAEYDIELDESLVLNGASKKETADRVVTALFAQSDRPSALVVLNNSMTIGALRALRRLGLHIPADVAFVSYDDFEWSDLFEPRLTTVAQDVEAMGEQAVELLLARMNGDTSEARRIRVPTTFEHRNSCGCDTQAPHPVADETSDSLPT
ncbi:LacI family DNA-binding transcriptional regulator [Agreia sp. PsM10]|uniref:LacI family DNA-binding transcriptional regulator n=1 Tax=Agreia sp. PsM10 TaxID=3030533 RepID=UPI00263B618E|nr:LacI family DNA-binding transcriptional regulator [Agreia sp. PsM10]MDN4642043.1 LacI family DNA-binding transcriptional regulator [Agreia sp. PsM10]